MKYLTIIWVAVWTLLSAACKKENDTGQLLKNDLLRKTIGPTIVGQPVEYVYALGALEGFVATATVHASISGADGTGFDSVSWYTDRNTGSDLSIRTTTSTTTNGAISTAHLIDTNVVALRYYYVVPESARGRDISFNFSGISTTGQQVSCSASLTPVSVMDMAREITLKDGENCYFSIENMTAYTEVEVESGNLSEKIDFVYMYRPTMGAGDYPFGHAFVALSNTQFLHDLSIPSSWTKRETQMDKRVDVRDAQLRGGPPAVFIDDRDLRDITFPNAPDYAFGFSTHHGAFMQTADGRYKAYVYVNALNANGEITLSLKRLRQ